MGKSAITLRYIADRFAPDYDPTIEDMHKKETVIDGETITLKILDTAGETDYAMWRRNWMKAGSGFLFVFSLVDRQTFDELTTLQDELMDLYDDEPPPSVILANKADMDEQLWVVSAEEVDRLRSSWHRCTGIYYTSAKTSKDVSEAFQCLCRASRAWRAERAAAERSGSNASVRRGDRSAAVRPLSYNAAASFQGAAECRRSRCCRCCRSGQDEDGCTVL